MNQHRLQASALKLKNILQQYSSFNEAVEGLSIALQSYIEPALTGSVLAPLDWRDIPGARSFSDGALVQYRDLEEAYDEFKIEITGGASPELQRYLAKQPK